MNICVNKLLSDIIKKYRKQIEESQITQMLNSNESANIIKVMDFISKKYNYNQKNIEQSNEYKKFCLLYEKCRFFDFPSLDFFNNISFELAEKFKLKIYKTFVENTIFYNSIDLINMIGIFGLFESDPESSKRYRKAIELFVYQDVFSKRRELSNNPNLIESMKNQYYINEELITYLSEEIKPYLHPIINSKYLSFLKKMRGNTGRRINDFLTPFSVEDDKNVLKKGAFKYLLAIDSSISNYSDKLTYQHLENLLGEEKINILINTYVKEKQKGYSIKRGLSIEEQTKMLSLFKDSELTYSKSDIHSMFACLTPIFSKEFYDFFVNHQVDILSSWNNYSKLPEIQSKFKDIKKYYDSRGNSNIDFITMIEYLRSIPYNISFGDQEFALEAKNAGVLIEGYDYYVSLLNILESRYASTIPRHSKVYTFVNQTGEKFTVESRILKTNDPLNLLVGESKYINCCQKYNDEGQICLEHASTSNMGGILIINLYVNDTPRMLTQSWIWSNEQEIVIDNVEEAQFLSESSPKVRQLYEDIVAFTIKNAGEDLLLESKKGIIVHANKVLDIIDNEIDPMKKSEMLIRLNEVIQRQTIKLVTLGSNYSDIIVSDYFGQLVHRNLYLPKDYPQNGYTDAKKRYVVAGSEDDITIKPSSTYIEEPIYVEEREVCVEFYENIKFKTLKKILKMKSDSNYNLQSKEEFFAMYNVDLYDALIFCGRDWFIIGELKEDYIFIKDFGLKNIADTTEKQKQLDEYQDTLAFIGNYQIKEENNVLKKRKDIL